MFTRERHRFTSIEGTVLMLDRWVKSRRLEDLVSEYGRSEAALCNIYNSMLAWLYRNHGHLLKNPAYINRQVCQRWGQALLAKGHVLHNLFIGFVDGTLRPVARPKVGQRLFYTGYKKFHAIKFLGICAPDGIMVYLDGPLEGSLNDHAHQDVSDVETCISRWCGCLDGVVGDDYQHLLILGDKGFHDQAHVAAMYKKPRGGDLTEAEREFNRMISPMRVCIEWEFGDILKLFPKLADRGKNRLLLSRVGVEYAVAVLMYNIRVCMFGRNEVADYFDVYPPSAEDYIG